MAQQVKRDVSSICRWPVDHITSVRDLVPDDDRVFKNRGRNFWHLNFERAAPRMEDSSSTAYTDGSFMAKTYALPVKNVGRFSSLASGATCACSQDVRERCNTDRRRR